ncbi:DUF6471 domain-containing protein [Phenylobacterium sp.]
MRSKGVGVGETKANVRNTIGFGVFTGVFLSQCLTAISVTTLQVEG